MPGSLDSIVYADCFSGASGDMFLGALLDVGLPEEKLRSQLDLLGLSLPEITITKVKEGCLAATKVVVEPEKDQPHRDWQEIKKIITRSDLRDHVKSLACNIFQELARAEARVHGKKEEEIHFHEVGGLDAIIDIVGTAVGLDHFGVDNLHCSPLPMPHGFVKCAHGSLPLPAPAVCEILNGVPVYGVDINQELVTPTGAAILKATCKEFGPLPHMILKQTGYGAGSMTRPDGKPNLLRLLLGKANSSEETQTVQVIETNLDDWSPEGFPYVSERLFSLGALDVILIPIQMKKGRPGFLLQVLANEANAWEIKRCLLSETSAIGLRFRTEERLTLTREIIKVNTQWGPVGAKRIETPTGIIITPEYEDCRRVAKKKGIPLRQVYAEVVCCGEEG